MRIIIIATREKLLFFFFLIGVHTHTHNTNTVKMKRKRRARWVGWVGPKSEKSVEAGI